jgi:hypothetical protein
MLPLLKKRTQLISLPQSGKEGLELVVIAPQVRSGTEKSLEVLGPRDTLFGS